jgi:hypothetical protein
MEAHMSTTEHVTDALTEDEALLRDELWKVVVAFRYRGAVRAVTSLLGVVIFNTEGGHPEGVSAALDTAIEVLRQNANDSLEEAAFLRADE